MLSHLKLLLFFKLKSVKKRRVTLDHTASPIAPCRAISSCADGIGLAGSAGDGVGLVSKGGGLAIVRTAFVFRSFCIPVTVEGGGATSVLSDLIAGTLSGGTVRGLRGCSFCGGVARAGNSMSTPMAPIASVSACRGASFAAGGSGLRPGGSRCWPGLLTPWLVASRCESFSASCLILCWRSSEVSPRCRSNTWHLRV